MDKLDDILLKNYRRIKSKLIPPKKECPKEDMLWNYVRGKLQEKEKEPIEGHLLACPECLESFKAIRMIVQAEKSPQQVPQHLHQKAKEIIYKELAESGLRPKNKRLIGKVALLWDQLRNKIIQLTPDLGEMINAPQPQFQPVRKAQQGVGEDLSAFPHRRSIEINEGEIFIEIDRSGKEGYLTLKTSFQSRPGKMADKLGSLRAILYKSDRICSSCYLDQSGQAPFHRIKEGKYYLELLAGDRSLGMVELAIGKVKK